MLAFTDLLCTGYRSIEQPCGGKGHGGANIAMILHCPVTCVDGYFAALKGRVYQQLSPTAQPVPSFSQPNQCCRPTGHVRETGHSHKPDDAYAATITLPTWITRVLRATRQRVALLTPSLALLTQHSPRLTGLSARASKLQSDQSAGNA